MRHHPLTPMTDANLVRVLQAQLRSGASGLIDHRTVARGAAKLPCASASRRCRPRACARHRRRGGRRRPARAGRASADLPLVVAGSGLAIGIPALHGLQPGAERRALPPAAGLARGGLSGSCSAATNAQVAHFIAQRRPGLRGRPAALAASAGRGRQALAWAAPRLAPRRCWCTPRPRPRRCRRCRRSWARERAGALVEQTLARMAAGLVARRRGQLVVAGGETSGACVQALGITQLRIGPQIDPGVPWCHAPPASRGLHLALKSGNFGGTDFFTRAFALL
jgi:3-dehydrotetronate 4-kinase